MTTFIDQTTIPFNELRSRYPIVFANRQADKLSDRYEFVRTSDMVQHFVDEGFVVADVMHGRRGRVSSLGTHSVRVRPTDAVGIRRVGELLPEIVITNSYDGSAAAQLDLGLFRLLCSNGMVLGVSCGMSYKMVHRGSIHEQLDTAIKCMLDYVPKVNDVVERWSERRLTNAERGEFNERVKTLRGVTTDADMLRVRRQGDEVDTLWGAFNVAQENMLRGGVAYRSESGRHMRMRPIRAVGRNLTMNKKLWDVAAEFLPA